MKAPFDHEKLTAYQEAIRFVVWVGDLMETGVCRLNAGGLAPQHLL